MIQLAFRQLLLNRPAVYDIAGDRVFFQIKPQNEQRPSVVLTTVDDSSGHDIEGEADYATGRVQVDCFAPTYSQAKQLAKAVRQALDGFEGTAGEVEVGYIEIEAERDVPAVPLEGKATPTYGVSLDATFLYQE